MRRLLISFSLFASFPMAGCVAAGVAGAGAVGTAVVQDKSLGTALDDATASSEIKAKLIRQSRAKFGEVDVEVSDGLVLLSGRVNSPEDKIFAERTAWSSSRTKDVANEINIEGPGGFMANVSDAIISTRVRAALASSRTVKSVNFNVETYNGVVYLMGIARSQKELEHAAEKASYVGGVNEVVSYVRLAEDRVVQAAPISSGAAQPLPSRPDPLQPGEPIGEPSYDYPQTEQTNDGELVGGGIY